MLNSATTRCGLLLSSAIARGTLLGSPPPSPALAVSSEPASRDCRPRVAARKLAWRPELLNWPAALAHSACLFQGPRRTHRGGAVPAALVPALVSRPASPLVWVADIHRSISQWTCAASGSPLDARPARGHQWNWDSVAARSTLPDLSDGRAQHRPGAGRTQGGSAHARWLRRR